MSDRKIKHISDDAKNSSQNTNAKHKEQELSDAKLDKKIDSLLGQKQPAKELGHEWDGITEYDNPDPVWLRLFFYGAIVFSLIYWVFYPSWPTPTNSGILGWSSRQQLEEQLKELEHLRSLYQAEFDTASFEEIMSDEKLYKFALAGGESAFNNNCVVCHQRGGVGALGYPNLTDDNWIWGGKIEDIYTTLLYGIRSGHEEARDSQMAAFGRDGILTSHQISLLAHFVKDMFVNQQSGRTESQDIAAMALFKEHCAACHGERGEGGREFGAPTLANAIWLYGGDYEQIYDVIYNGRAGVMPFWSGKLTDSTIRQLAVYVHELGGGEN